MASREPYFSEDASWTELRGLEQRPLSDAYNLFLRARWRYALLAIVLTLALVNLLFATLYWLVGGIDGVHGFGEAFFFSVETLATVGYGAMHPVTTAAHVVTVVQIFTGLVLTALMTGLVFGKFSLPKARVRFTRQLCIGRVDGVDTLMFRLANQRGGQVLHVDAHLIVAFEDQLAEGGSIYRMRDLRLHRERIPTLSRTWLGLHAITPGSPLHGLTAEHLRERDAEFLITLSGSEHPTAQPFQAAHSWVYDQVRFGARFADMLLDLPDGSSVVDFTRFDEVVPDR